MLRTIRLTIALLFFILITLLFLDFTGTLHAWFGWMAKIQFLPALLALNAGIIVFLVLLTLLFGRIYCSVICPLGVFQDIISWIAGKRKKNRFRYSPALTWLRYGMLGILVIAFIAGLSPLVALFAPYSAYGRIASNLFAPVWQWGNNVLAHFAERMDSYAFYETEVWLKSLPTFLIAIGTLVVIFVLAWRGGRTYCNTLCPVGTILGTLSKYSLLKPVIDTEKCNGCGLCARNCKASCINSKAHEIDYSRCVACMDCIGKCKQNAISYTRQHTVRKPVVALATEAASPLGNSEIQATETSGNTKRVAAKSTATATAETVNVSAKSPQPAEKASKTTTKSATATAQTYKVAVQTSNTAAKSSLTDAKASDTMEETSEVATHGAATSAQTPTEQIDSSRRSFLTTTALVAGASLLQAQEKKVDGGLAVIENKQIPNRSTPITPPGALGARHFAQHCTACQLCVSVCPNQVLRPPTDFMKFMQPEMSYERGYCRPECTKCADVCPAGAIHPITVADKSSIQIGHAIWTKANCVPLTDGVDCGNCARHCPTGAITMVLSDPNVSDSPKIPAVDTERCIGCGACENLCPARPFSAIYVEGHERHRTI